MICRLRIGCLGCWRMIRISWCCIRSRSIGGLLFITRRWRVACDHRISFLLFQRGPTKNQTHKKEREIEKATAEENLTRSVMEQYKIVDTAGLHMPLV